MTRDGWSKLLAVGTRGMAAVCPGRSYCIVEPSILCWGVLRWVRNRSVCLT